MRFICEIVAIVLFAGLLCEIVGLGLDEACGRTVSGDREAVA